MSISIIIVNFNYGRYIRQAIESALAVVAPRKQIIIVDDGSTDNSRSVINEYAKKATIIFKKNEGQFSSYNSGFLVATGRWILFLDSDDYLFPNIFKELRPFLNYGVSKIQFQSQVIDRFGRQSNKIVPRFKLNTNSKNIRKWNLTTGSYPSAWGSGNLYSKAFLKKIFPLNSHFERVGDVKPIILAPFYGKVETCRKPLAAYRIHGKNDSNKSFLFLYLRLVKRLKYRMMFARQNKVLLSHHFPKRNIELIYKTLLIKKLFPYKNTLFSCNYYDLFLCLFVSQPVSFKKEVFYLLFSFFLFFCNKTTVKKHFWFFGK